MHEFRQVIGIMAADDSQWGPRDADGRRRKYTADELDALVDFRWRWPDIKGFLATVANAVRSHWWSRASTSVAQPRLPPAESAPRV